MENSDEAIACVTILAQDLGGKCVCLGERTW